MEDIESIQEKEEETVKNQLINKETIKKYIEASFNGSENFFSPMKADRSCDQRRKNLYVEEVCNDQPKIMKKIHSVKQGSIFSRSFHIKSLDSEFSDDIEYNEKFKIIDKVIDYVDEDLRKYSPPQSKRFQDLIKESSFCSRLSNFSNDHKTTNDDNRKKLNKSSSRISIKQAPKDI